MDDDIESHLDGKQSIKPPSERSPIKQYSPHTKLIDIKHGTEHYEKSAYSIR